MKVQAKQTAFSFYPERRMPVAFEHNADFTSMTVGHMVGNESRVIRCPTCGRNCIAQERWRNWRFVHQAKIQSSAKTVRFEPSAYCELDHDEVRALQEKGQIVRNRLGQILEVRAQAPESPA